MAPLTRPPISSTRPQGSPAASPPPPTKVQHQRKRPSSSSSGTASKQARFEPSNYKFSSKMDAENSKGHRMSVQNFHYPNTVACVRRFSRVLPTEQIDVCAHLPNGVATDTAASAAATTSTTFYVAFAAHLYIGNADDVGFEAG
ncbi:cell division protein SepF [Striga asiatica]|uniref:Cell division protein SepF n=1 Tax=Striga asiatica TaxID=4170 RepID=A0A5A7PN74_STRAF|nr:cell division protein SepF [Striga asiatica]